MKQKLFFAAVCFTFFIALSAHAQYLEFNKIFANTISPQTGRVVKQLPDGGYLVASEGQVISPTPQHWLTLYRIDKNGDTIFSKTILNKRITADNIEILKNGKYMVYSNILYGDSIYLGRFLCDSNGKGSYNLFNTYYLSALDSDEVNHSNIGVKYLPNEGFYIYGYSPYAGDSSYILWKLDTMGKIKWRQDYYDTCNGEHFNLTKLKNKQVLLTSTIYNRRMSGFRILLMDTSGNVVVDKKLRDPFLHPFAGYGYSKIQTVEMQDSSIVLAASGFFYDDAPWTLLPVTIQDYSSLLLLLIPILQ